MAALGTSPKAEEIASSVRNLPSLPAVIQKLLMVLEDMSCSAMDIERIVATDPALTARILKLANSPLYKGIDDVATISQAVTRLGFWKLRDVAINIGTTETLSGMANQKFQQEYWHHAVYTATCAKALATAAGMPFPEVTFVTGLLHDIGELVLAAVAPEQFEHYLTIAPEGRLEHEEELFGATHPRVGSMLLKQWLLPKPLYDAVRLHHTEQVFTSKREPVISIIALSDMLSKVHNIGAEPGCSNQTLLELVKRAGLEFDQIGEVLGQVDKQVADTQKHLEIAGDVSFLTPPGSSRSFDVAIVSTNSSLVTWLEQLLSYFGHTTMSLQEFHEDPHAAELVLVDPDLADSKMLGRLTPALSEARSCLATVGSATFALPEELPGPPIPKISVFLTQEEIKQRVRDNLIIN